MAENLREPVRGGGEEVDGFDAIFNRHVEGRWGLHSYLASEMGFEVTIRVWPRCYNEYPSYLQIRLQNSNPLEHPVDRSAVRTGTLIRKAVTPAVDGVLKVTRGRGGGQNVDKPVFVVVRQKCQIEEAISFGARPGVIRLEFFEEVPIIRQHLLRMEMSRPFGCVPDHRELDIAALFLRRLITSMESDGELPSEMVKNAPQVMEYFANHERPMPRNLREVLNSVDNCPFMSIVFPASGDPPTVGFPNFGYLTAQRVSVKVCPVEFGPTATEVDCIGHVITPSERNGGDDVP